MQICVPAIKFSSFTCYDTVSTHDITLMYLLINCCATSYVYQYGMHDTTYDTCIVASLSIAATRKHGREPHHTKLGFMIFRILS
jgi:hypothetical protein